MINYKVLLCLVICWYATCGTECYLLSHWSIGLVSFVDCIFNTCIWRLTCCFSHPSVFIIVFGQNYDDWILFFANYLCGTNVKFIFISLYFLSILYLFQIWFNKKINLCKFSDWRDCAEKFSVLLLFLHISLSVICVLVTKFILNSFWYGLNLAPFTAYLFNRINIFACSCIVLLNKTDETVCECSHIISFNYIWYCQWIL